MSGLKRKSALKRSAMPRDRKPLERRARINPRNEGRRLRDWPRQFHSPERVAWVKSLPCATCENRGRLPVENSHLVPRRVGTWADIVPMCTTCHREFGEGRHSFCRRRGIALARLKSRAAEVELAWVAIQTEGAAVNHFGLFPDPSRINFDRAKYVYVASSWRNQLQPLVCERLRGAKIDHFDFRNPPGGTGFGWSQVKPAGSPQGIRAKGADWEIASDYLEMVRHPRAIQGFEADYGAMKKADAVVLILPCGKSAHLELGWAVGAGKRTAILLEDPVEPELMYRMADFITADLEALLRFLGAGHEQLVPNLWRPLRLEDPGPSGELVELGKLSGDGSIDVVGTVYVRNCNSIPEQARPLAATHYRVTS